MREPSLEPDGNVTLVNNNLLEYVYHRDYINAETGAVYTAPVSDKNILITITVHCSVFLSDKKLMP